MPRVGFEPTIPMFEWAKTVHALDRAATVISYHLTIDGYNGGDYNTTPFHLNVDNETNDDYVKMTNHLHLNENSGDDGGRTEITESNYQCNR
jgi:hypothetical protein